MFQTTNQINQQCFKPTDSTSTVEVLNRTNHWLAQGCNVMQQSTARYVNLMPSIAQLWVRVIAMMSFRPRHPWSLIVDECDLCCVRNGSMTKTHLMISDHIPEIFRRLLINSSVQIQFYHILSIFYQSEYIWVINTPSAPRNELQTTARSQWGHVHLSGLDCVRQMAINLT
jgi:hypothetical protein